MTKTGLLQPRNDDLEPRDELAKIAGKVDQSLTGHSILRDSFARLALILDLALIILSAGITFLAVANDFLKTVVLPSTIDVNIMLPLLALLVLIGSIVQFRAGWKGRSAAHGEAARTLARFKHELRKSTGSSEEIANHTFKDRLSHYQYLSDSITNIPDKHFLRLKKAHKQKVEISSFLDKHPSSSIPMLRVRMFLRDNFGISLFKKNGGGIE